MAKYGTALARRLYPRYKGEYPDNGVLEELMREDAVVALIQFLLIGLNRRDLQRDEVSEALELARDGKLLKSSLYLHEALTEYQRSLPAA